MAGEYKQILLDHLENDNLRESIRSGEVRIAITNSIKGDIIKLPNLVETFIDTLHHSDNPMAGKYINGLSDGTMIPITIRAKEKIYSSGELFFTT